MDANLKIYGLNEILPEVTLYKHIPPWRAVIFV